MIETLNALPQARIVSHDDALQYVLEASLGGTGIGYVDAHLLASCSSFRLPLWTRDKRLAAQAERLGLLYSPD
ncbi:MAG: hypothetical protein KJZ64_06530 [Sphingomonadaceae bacterium]|nr:hypothetical protein [Sphingomonadaceae bacterium]